jgi:hypothetical protein
MSIPKIVFKEMTLEDNIDIIKWTFFEDNGVFSLHNYTVKCFPKLESIDNNLPLEDKYKIIKDVVKEEYDNSIEIIKNDVNRYNLLWEKYNDKYFIELSKYFNIDWPNIDEIVATVGIIPTFPRYLDDYSFSIGTGLDDTQLIEVSAHETLHFIWFKKWKKLHPKISRREYDSPYLPWKYSEMVTDPILNNKPFKDMFNFTEKSYDYFYELEDNGTKVMDILRDIYKEDISIEEKINKGYEYVKNIVNTDSDEDDKSGK